MPKETTSQTPPVLRVQSLPVRTVGAVAPAEDPAVADPAVEAPAPVAAIVITRSNTVAPIAHRRMSRPPQTRQAERMSRIGPVPPESRPQSYSECRFGHNSLPER